MCPYKGGKAWQGEKDGLPSVAGASVADCMSRWSPRSKVRGSLSRRGTGGTRGVTCGVRIHGPCWELLSAQHWLGVRSTRDPAAAAVALVFLCATRGHLRAIVRVPHTEPWPAVRQPSAEPLQQACGLQRKKEREGDKEMEEV
jgi:hypothetical protein